MADQLDELVQKIVIEVDDKDVIDLEKELKELRKNTLNVLKVEREKGTPNAAGKFDTEEKGTLKESLATQKQSLELLKKISDLEKKEEYDKLRKNGEGKEEEGSGLVGFGLGLAGLLTAFAGIVTAGSAKIQKMYTEKLDREMDLASLAYETGQTVDTMKDLNYQARLVGLSMDEITDASKNFANEVFTGSNQQQMAIANALGINLVQRIRDAKTPQQMAMIQSDLYKETFEKLLPKGYAFASSQASKLSGLSSDEAFRLQHINDSTVVKGARQLSDLRGSIGSRAEVIERYEQNNLSQQRVKANLDRALSAGNVAQRISIDRANMEAKVVNLIAQGVNGISGAFSSGDNTINNFLGTNNNTNLKSNHNVHTNPHHHISNPNMGHYNNSRSSAITKAGGG